MFILGILEFTTVVIFLRSLGIVIPKGPLLVVSINKSVFVRLDNRPNDFFVPVITIDAFYRLITYCVCLFNLKSSSLLCLILQLQMA